MLTGKRIGILVLLVIAFILVTNSFYRLSESEQVISRTSGSFPAASCSNRSWYSGKTFLWKRLIPSISDFMGRPF